jgi:sterol 24-C-methyltransferase
MAPTAEPREDGRQEKRVDGYTKFWQKDASNEAEVDTSNRLDSYTDVVNGMSNATIEAFLCSG